jgi:DNA replication and repair protein RecF
LLTDFDPSTGELIERFNRTLTQRNAFLRSLNGERPTVSQQNELEVWTSDFSESSQLLLIQRRILIDQLSPLVSDFYRELAHDTVDVSVVYETSWAGELGVALERLYNEDRLRGFTSVGPHRDDVSFSLNGRDVRRKASQGEQRSLALALRLGGHALIRQQRNLDPLLLLDDVFSELDPSRSDRLLQLMPAGQTLVSTASPLPTNLTPSMVIDLSKVMS